jgi:hypothetical protein
MKRYLVAIAAALTIVLLAACGGDDAATTTPAPSSNVQGSPNGTGPTPRITRTAVPPSPGAAPLPCSLLTNDQVQTLIGSITTAQPSATECQYTGDTGTLKVHLEPKAADVAAATSGLATLAGSAAQSAPAGDEAFYVGDTQIAARKGLYVFSLTASKPAKDELLTLAQAAANNLPAAQ